MSTKSETVLGALKTQLEAYFADGELWTGDTITVDRNAAEPEEIAGGGLVIIRDGDPGQPDQALGQVGGCYYQHSIEIEIYVQDGLRAARDALYSALLAGVGAALEADKTLDGNVLGMIYGPPEPLTTLVEGAGDIKSGVIRPVVDYEASSPLG